MFKVFCVLCICCWLGACASQFADKYVGRPAVDLLIEEGNAENTFDLPDGRRVFQYRWGGGTFVRPTTMTGSVNVVGNSAFMNSTVTPGAVINSPGCLISFIAEKRNGQLFVTEARLPNPLRC